MSEAKLLVLLDQIVPNAGYFAVKGQDMAFDIFNQIWTYIYVQNSIFGRLITPELTSQEYN